MCCSIVIEIIFLENLSAENLVFVVPFITILRRYITHSNDDPFGRSVVKSVCAMEAG